VKWHYRLYLPSIQPHLQGQGACWLFDRKIRCGGSDRRHVSAKGVNTAPDTRTADEKRGGTLSGSLLPETRRYVDKVNNLILSHLAPNCAPSFAAGDVCTQNCGVDTYHLDNPSKKQIHVRLPMRHLAAA